MMIDSLGTPFSAGGLNLSLRDAARFGQTLLQQAGGRAGDSGFCCRLDQRRG